MRLQADLTPEIELNSVKSIKTIQQPWPGTLPLQVSATAQLLANAGAAMSLSEIQASFKGKDP